MVYIGLKKSGQGNYMESWDDRRWSHKYANGKEHFPDVREEAKKGI
jgi:DNA-binding transcriptional regulator/RsmH inhibitor MraZ